MQTKQLLVRILITSALSGSLCALGMPVPVPAQQTSSPPSQDATQSQDPNAKPDDDKSNAQPLVPAGIAWSDTYIRQIGYSGILAGNREGIGWGSLYIPTASALGLTETLEAAPGTQTGGIFNAGLFEATVVYDHRLGSGSRLALQYSPSMAIADGRVVGNFSNQNTSVDVLLFERPRWNIRFNDTFNYYYSQQFAGLPSFDVDAATSGIVTNMFLTGPDRWLSTTASGTIAYALSARSSLSIRPTYTYSESGVGANLSRANLFGGTADWRYLVSDKQSVGLEFGGQLLQEYGIGTLAPSSTDTTYYTVAGTAGRQISPTWYVAGAAGFTISSLNLGPATQHQVFFNGSLTALKQWRRNSTLGFNYTRAGTVASGLISSSYADRLDVTFQNKVTRRFDWRVGGGYLAQVNSSGFSAWYGTASLEFMLAPRAGLFATGTYTHIHQDNNVSRLFRGDTELAFYGISWYPSRMVR